MIYFIRHAESKYNAVEQDIRQRLGPNYKETEEYQTAKFNRKYIDVEITEEGIEQCAQSRAKMKDIDVDLIIVSPMRRALKTCALTFEGHKSKAPVIVHPDFREVLCSSNDIGAMAEESQKEYKDYDFSLLKDLDVWYLNNLNDQEIRERLLNKVKESKTEPRKEEAIEVTIEFLREWFEKRMANPDNQESLIRRVLPDLNSQKTVMLEKLQKYKSIAVVSHSENMKAFIGYKIKNCQVYPYEKERLQKCELK